jgi:hypothetical protein
MNTGASENAIALMVMIDSRISCNGKQSFVYFQNKNPASRDEKIFTQKS